MAYMNQEKKAAINHNLKQVVPKGWKYSLRVSDGVAIVCTIRDTPVPMNEVLSLKPFQGGTVAIREARRDQELRNGLRVNTFAVDHYVKSKYYKTVQAIVDALNTGNYDNTDPMTGYSDVGHYAILYFQERNRAH